MRDAEADIAEALSIGEWLTVLDGPPGTASGTARGLPRLGYREDTPPAHARPRALGRVPELTAWERSGLFAMEDALYGCYLRAGRPWAVGGSSLVMATRR